MYINCHTYYSLRYGTLSPTQLVMTAKKRGIKALVLTDINNTSCSGEFIQLCEKEGIRPILGIEFRREHRLLYIGIAQNKEGFLALNDFLSTHSLSGKKLPDVPPPIENVWIVYDRLVKPIRMFKDNELLGVRPEHVYRLFSAEVRHFPQKLVMLCPVTFLDMEGYALHQLLRAVDLNTLISKLTRKDIAKKTELLHPPDALKDLYKTYPQLIENTERILATCFIEMERGLSTNRQHFTGSKTGDFNLLTKLAMNGCKRRYGVHNLSALERVKKELKVIQQQDFCSYFLITWDIVRYAQSMGYYHVGRGSGANSIVAFCLRITDVDPLELDLYFERFINPYRQSPPDFDIDFSWDERDDVVDYIFKRYGSKYTALLATYSTFKYRAAIRELGKVFGLPKGEIDKIAQAPFIERVSGQGDISEERGGVILSANRYPDDTSSFLGDVTWIPSASELRVWAKKLEGFPNYLSIHAGGIVISEQPIGYHTALQMMPKGFPIAHFDMNHAEALGFHKFDVLSQRGLGHIKDAVDLIEQNQGKAVDVHKIALIKRDPRVKAQLKSGHCIGCFYIESPAMRGLLQKLRCDNYIHLVAASSIIRPGVASSGMMREYIYRFHNPNAFEYLHPVFEEHLGETFGVMVYQEDVMKIVHHFAGLDLDEADVLRRMMTGKKFSSAAFQRLQQKYLNNCQKRGYTEKLTQEVWRQIVSFSGYSFCKAHSASFAVESFQSLYLKTHYPLEFMVAVINNFGGFYQTEYYFHEAKMQGGQLHAPCVNKSLLLTTIYGKDIYIGFIHLHQLERNTAHAIVHQRALGGEFASLLDFTQRVNISTEQLDILIRINAFRFTSKSKAELMWEKNAAISPRIAFESTGRLFDTPLDKYELPPLETGEYDQFFDEIELLGFSLCSPFDLLDKKYRNFNATRAQDLSDCANRMVTLLGYYVCQKPVRTVNGKRMAFGTWLDEEGHFFDTVHFPNFLKRFPFRGKGIYWIKGKVSLDFGVAGVEVLEMRKVPWIGRNGNAII